MLFAIDFVRAGSGGAKEYMESMISYLGKRQDIEYLLILNRDQPSNLSRSLSKNSVVICPFKNIVFVVLWQAFILPVILRRRNVQSLLITDASTTVFFKKQIVMHRDMLAFDSQLVSQYLKHRLYKKYVRLKMIKYLQIFNLWYASKALFLTDHAKETVFRYCTMPNSVVIPHGIRKEYFETHEKRRDTDVVVTYVSNSAPYKHQINLIKAFETVQTNYFDKLRLKLVGASSGDTSEQLLRYIDIKNHAWLTVLPFLAREKVIDELINSSFFVFLSSCECMPNTLLQKMAQGKAILCSNLRPMTDILPEDSVFCDPLDVASIIEGLSTILSNSNGAFERKENSEIAKQYTWDKSFDLVLSELASL
jgi:glycosyltransferase involved in cell wall biosynthesis